MPLTVWRPSNCMKNIAPTPNLDGLDATRIIREVSPKIPVIAVSAYAYEKDKAAAIESGCNEFLTKPISPDLLKDTINKYLKNT